MHACTWLITYCINAENIQLRNNFSTNACTRLLVKIFSLSYCINAENISLRNNFLIDIFYMHGYMAIQEKGNFIKVHD